MSDLIMTKTSNFVDQYTLECTKNFAVQAKFLKKKFSCNEQLVDSQTVQEVK